MVQKIGKAIMTVSSTNNKSGPYTGNGVTTIFARTFLVTTEAMLKVYQTVDGVTSEVTTGITKDGIGSVSGNVTFSTAPETGVDITLIREVDLTQESDYSNQGTVPPENIEDDLDLQVMQMQDLAEQQLRVPKIPVTETSIGEIPALADRAGYFYAWDVNGDPVAVAGVPDAPVSTFMATVLDDVDAEAARATLGHFDSLALLYADTNLTATNTSIGDIISAGQFRYQVVSSLATDHLLETAGGVKLTNVEGDARAFNAATAKPFALYRDEADTLSANLGAMVGYADYASTTGGGSGTIYWVTNGTDSEFNYVENSFRWAVEQQRAAGSGRVVFDPRHEIEVVLTAQIETPPDITIDAPGRNATITSCGDVTKLKVVNDNCVIRRLNFRTLPNITVTDRDCIWIDPNLADKVWVDECSFERGQDGCIDIATTAVLAADSRITVSRCTFRGHDKTMLIGALSSVYTDPIHILVTVYACLFDHTGQRHPKAAQQAFAHVVNCYTKVLQISGDDGSLGAAYGVWADTGGQALVEASWYEAAVGDGFDAVYSGTNGKTKVSNCFTKNSLTLTEQDASGVTVPPYTTPGIAAVDGEAGRISLKDQIILVAGSAIDASPQGKFLWDATSTAEPDGMKIISEGADVAGRWLRVDHRQAAKDTATDAVALHGSENLEISSGLLARPTARRVEIQTEGLSAADDFDRMLITGASQGDAITFFQWSSGDVVTIKHASGTIGNAAQILLAGGVDFTFASTNDNITLMYSNTAWVEISRTVI